MAPKQREQKDLTFAYWMLFLFGALGIHQFYIGRYWRGLLLLSLLGTSYLCFVFQLRWWMQTIPLGVVGGLIWLFDAITLYWQVKKVNTRIKEQNAALVSLQ